MTDTNESTANAAAATTTSAGEETASATTTTTTSMDVSPTTATAGPTAMVRVRSVDDFEFELPIKAAILSQLLRDSLPEEVVEHLENSGSGGSNDTTTITVDKIETIDLLRVSKKPLEKVVDFLKHYVEEPMDAIPVPFQQNTFNEVIKQEWYQKFCDEENMPREMLAEILSAANYMAIPQLLDLTCLKFTFALQGKNEQEIREMLNLPELTPEEEQRAREEHRWLFED